MTDFLTSAQMRAVERAAIESGTVTGQGLMDCAGRGVVDAAFAHWPALAEAPGRAVVLCGPGNNGGDGFVVAHYLQAAGWSVDVFFYGEPDRLSPEAGAMRAQWAAEGPIHALDFPVPHPDQVVQVQALLDAARRAGPVLLVDALFGIGLSRSIDALDDVIAIWRQFHADNNMNLVAIDLPSGLDADTGDPVARADGSAGGVFPAELTVTFHRPKAGHLQGAGPRSCGTLAVVDIGVGPWDGARDGD